MIDASHILYDFDRLPPLSPVDMAGLWKGNGIPSGHPLDQVLEDLGQFGNRLGADLRADALPFEGPEKRLLAVSPDFRSV